MNWDDIQANIRDFVTTRTPMLALTSQPAPCSLIELPYLADSRFYFEALQPLKNVVWLDSGMCQSPRNDANRFDILTAEPISQLFCPTIDEIKVQLKAVRQDYLPCSESDRLPFVGGIIGTLHYENQQHEITVPPGKRRHGHWGVFNWSLIQDHIDKRCILVSLPSCPKHHVARRLALLTEASIHKDNTADTFCTSRFEADSSREEYNDAFAKIQEYILAGDCYQVNFAQRFRAKFRGDSRDAYIFLRSKQNGHYSAYSELGTHKILSFSPEQFVSAKNSVTQTKPIKGTIKRGKTTQEDQIFAQQLQSSPKDRAENLMIVDLLRNDFSKSCEPFSVKVEKLFDLETYTNVHHLVSTITGRLRNETEFIDFFMRCFPGGSITGAPKQRAMEVIDELEKHARHIYCGSIVYFSANKRLDSSVAIRTLLLDGNDIYCWGGGGIVADSKVDEEYEESIQKVRLLMSALSES